MKVSATRSALSLLSELKEKYGEKLMFHQSGGCCDGSAPMCFQEGEFPLGGTIFAKAGISRGDLKVDSLTTTSGDGLIDNVDTLMGHTVGLGYERDISGDTFVRAEVNYSTYDDVTGTSNNLAGNDTAKTFKADLDLTMFMISFGKKF